MGTMKSTLVISAIDQASGPLRRIGGVIGGFQSQVAGITGAIGRLAAIGGAYIGVTQGIDGTLGAARRMQASLTEVGIKAGLSGGQIEQLRQKVMGLSPTTNQTTTALIEGIDVMVGLGLSAQQAAAAIPAIGKAATATRASIAYLSAAATSAMQNLKIAPEDLTKTLDALAAAGNAGAFELRDMAQYLPSLGAAYQGLGQTGVKAAADLAAALQIVRTGTGDSASAATNLGNVLQKINAPLTRKKFRKFGVNLEKEMKRAAERGLTPIEAIAEITSKTLKGDLGKLGDLFEDSQVQQGLRPLIQSIEKYRKIRAEALASSGTVDKAFQERMRDAEQKFTAFSIRMQNLGAAMGNRMLEPLGKVADYLTNVFDTMDQRVSVFDQINSATKGFLSGLGVDMAAGSPLQQIGDMIFGVRTNAEQAGDTLGEITARFRSYGEAIANNPIARFMTELAASIAVLAASRWGQLFIVASGVYTLVQAVRGAESIGAFVEALKGLSALEWAGIGAGLLFVAGKVKRLIDLFRSLRTVLPDAPGEPKGGGKKGGGRSGGAKSAPAGELGPWGDGRTNNWERGLRGKQAWIFTLFDLIANMPGEITPLTDADRARLVRQKQEKDAKRAAQLRSEQQAAASGAPRGGIYDALNPTPTGALDQMLAGLARATDEAAKRQQFVDQVTSVVGTLTDLFGRIKLPASVVGPPIPTSRPDPNVPIPTPRPMNPVVDLKTEVDLTDAKRKVTQGAGELGRALQINGKATIDSSAIDAALAKAERLVSILRQAGQASASMRFSRGVDASGLQSDMEYSAP